MIVSSYFVQMIVFGQLGFLGVASACLPEMYVLTGLLTAIAYIRHSQNIKRLATGTENKFLPKKDKKTA